jgi:hypothetical protein
MLMQVALRGKQDLPRHSGTGVVMQRAAGAPGEPPSEAMDDHRALSSAIEKAVDRTGAGTAVHSGSGVEANAREKAV